MLKIRAEQWQALAEVARSVFEDRMATHAAKFWPDQVADLGDDGLRQRIRAGIEQARECGLCREYDIQRYLNHVFEFGLEFVSDPRLPWAREILDDGEVDPTTKIDRLCERSEQEPTSPQSGAGGAPDAGSP